MKLYTLSKPKLWFLIEGKCQMVTDTGVGLMVCNSFPGGVTMVSKTLVCLVLSSPRSRLWGSGKQSWREKNRLPTPTNLRYQVKDIRISHWKRSTLSPCSSKNLRLLTYLGKSLKNEALKNMLRELEGHDGQWTRFKAGYHWGLEVMLDWELGVLRK